MLGFLGKNQILWSHLLWVGLKRNGADMHTIFLGGGGNFRTEDNIFQGDTTLSNQTLPNQDQTKIENTGEFGCGAT